MHEMEFGVVTMVVGALLGAVLSPAIEHVVANRFSKSGPSHSFANGLVLLCSANAAWVLSFVTLRLSERAAVAIVATAALYLVTLILFIAAYNQLKDSAVHDKPPGLHQLVMPLLAGNLLWVIGEGSELPLMVFGRDSFPYLYGKYICFIMSGLSFLYGLRVYYRIRKADA